jgi:hypothetical protein
LQKWKVIKCYKNLKSHFKDNENKNTTNMMEIEISYDSLINKKYINYNISSINNDELLVDIHSFLNDGDINNQSNLILRIDMDFYKMVKPVNKQLWEFFHSKYQGGPQIYRKRTLNLKANKSNDLKSLDVQIPGNYFINRDKVKFYIKYYLVYKNYIFAYP